MTTPSLRVPSRERAWLLTCLLGVVATLTACSAPEPQSISDAAIDRVAPAGTPVPTYRGMVPAHPYTMPAATFTDTDGRPFELPASVTSPVTLVFFGYTHCPNVCTTVLADVAQALRRMDPGQRTHVRLVFVTTDPARDTPKAIRNYLDRFDDSFIGLTAPIGEVERVATALGVPLEGTKRLPGGGYEVGHGAQIVGFDAERRGRVVWLEDTPIGDLRRDFATLVEASR